MALTIVNYLGHNPADNSHNWKEWEIQSYIVMELRRMGYTVHGDANGASKTPKGMMQAKVMGALAGWPDLTIVLPGRIVWVELKLVKGVRSPAQVEVHDTFQTMGHIVHTVYADCPADGLCKVMVFLAVPE